MSSDLNESTHLKTDQGSERLESVPLDDSIGESFSYIQEDDIPVAYNGYDSIEPRRDIPMGNFSMDISSDTFEDDPNRQRTFTSTAEYEAKIMKEVRKYRFKYLCFRPCKDYRKNAKRRVLSGSQVYYALILLFLEKLAYASIVGNIADPFFSILHLRNVYTSIITTTLFEVMSQIFFPIAGLLGDRYIGRPKAAHYGLWIQWIGYALVTFTSAFDNNTEQSLNRFFLPIFLFIIAIGSAAFQANMIPFGADQISYKSSEELSSYFYWYYWVRNLGGILLIVAITCSDVSFGVHTSIFGVISTAAISLALIFNQCIMHRFVVNKKKQNPLKTIFQVVKFVIRVKRPTLRSAFSYTGVKAPSRIDLAKEVHGGHFTNAQVEDVKTVLRLLVFMFTLIGVLMAYTGIVNIISIQARGMVNNTFTITESNHHQCVISNTFTWSINIVTILISIPIINFIIFPLLREYTPNIQKKIGLGYILGLLSPLILLIISAVGYVRLENMGIKGRDACFFDDEAYVLLPVNAWIIVIPHCIISIAEIFIVVSGLEMFYAQSPHTMRGMMLGLFFSMWSLATILANVCVYMFSHMHIEILSCGLWYYLSILILGAITFAVFLCVSKWYSNRKRGDIQPDLYYHLQ